MDKAENFFKNDVEYIISPYSNGERWFAAVFSKTGAQGIEFGFTSKEKALEWVADHQESVRKKQQ